jgi:2-polyprenyl-6-hydroxyphenyl methylase/3-demethylubiquinone-9 3-methyltransferase
MMVVQRSTIIGSHAENIVPLIDHSPHRNFSSVSELEVSKFAKFSKTWWDPKINPLVGMNPIRVEYMIQQLPSSSTNKTNNLPPLSGLTALDVGCGGGLLSESLARLGATVMAIDPSTELVEQAQHHARLDRRTRSIDYRGGWTVEQLAEQQAQESNQLFDVICLLEVIEHVTDVDSILKAVSSLLKPDGTLFVSTMSRTLKSKVVAVVGAEYVMRYLPPGTHDWNQFRSPDEVQTLVKKVGLEQVDASGMVLASPPLFGQWNWKLDPNDMDINWIGAYRRSTKSETT